jgi:hypothetical protein
VDRDWRSWRLEQQAPLVTRWKADLFRIAQRWILLSLWAQRVALGKEQPAEGPLNVAHFHKTHLSMMNVAEGPLEISVAQDKIVFNLSELTGNIWAGEIR